MRHITRRRAGEVRRLRLQRNPLRIAGAGRLPARGAAIEGDQAGEGERGVCGEESAIAMRRRRGLPGLSGGVLSQVGAGIQMFGFVLVVLQI